MNKDKPVILTLCDYYLPGYKAGGPIRTLTNMINYFHDEFSFKIITRDRDIGDSESYSGVVQNSWQTIGKTQIFYMTPNIKNCDFRKIIIETNYDLLYLNSFFSSLLTIKPLILRRLGLLKMVPVILAPRGELSPGALALNKNLKCSYLFISNVLGLYNDLLWQASSIYEKKDILRVFGKSVIKIAPDMPPLINVVEESIIRKEKTLGHLKVLFLSRISPMKNLKGVLNIIGGLKDEIELNIYGPIENINYWRECQRLMYGLPGNIRAKYHGELNHNQVEVVLCEHDLFFLPTLGENFGHVIFEALIAGCPVLISDKTPWRGLEDKGVGWDLPMDRPDLFRAVLENCIKMDAVEYRELSQRAKKYGIQKARDKDVVDRNRELFMTALECKC